MVIDRKEVLEKSSICGSANLLYPSFTDMIPSFLPHHYTKRCQSEHHNDLKERALKEKRTAMLQVDFPENFSTLWQDKIQSGTKKQVTILTAAYWNNKELSSAVVVSDNLNHKKNSIVTFVDRLISELVDVDVSLLHIWSIGPSSQFKNKYITVAIPVLEQIHSLDKNGIILLLLKGCVDEIAKRVVQRRAIVKDAKSFFDCCNELNLSVKFFLVASHALKTSLQKLD